MYVFSLRSRAKKGSDFHSFYKQDFAGFVVFCLNLLAMCFEVP